MSDSTAPSDAARPLCFVLMPFGKKKDPAGGPDIDFDTIYRTAIKPAIVDSGMEPIRADEEHTAGIIHKAMFERLLLCEFAVADLTTANANVFYELGVRHAARPATTVGIFAVGHTPPFDLSYLRGLPYEFAPGNVFGDEQAAKLRPALADDLRKVQELAIKDDATDSPIFQLLTDYGRPNIERLKTDTFRDQARYADAVKQKLAAARRANDAAEVDAIRGAVNPAAVEVGVLVDLFLSYRAVSAWEKMIEFYHELPLALQRTVMLREQFGFALNRAGRRDEAIDVLEKVIADRGPSSETCGILGRVYKDRWQEALTNGSRVTAAGFLRRAVDTYLQGFEADWRDAYPGINAVTLLEIQGDLASLARKDEILPVVRYAVTRRLKGGKPDYWDHATLLELAVLGNDEAAAANALADAMAAVREKWEPQTTANNLVMIRDARRQRGDEQPWLEEIIAELLKKAAK